LLYGTQSKSQNAIHEIERISFDVERSVSWIGKKQIVGDPPGTRVAMIIDEQSESSHVGDVDECVVTFVDSVADVDRERHEQRIILELFFWELISTQDLICFQRE